MVGDNILCFFQHLALCDPQGGFGNRGGKVIYFDTIKLMDGNLNRIDVITHRDLVCLATQSVIFQSPQRNIAFGQKITRAAGGV